MRLPHAIQALAALTRPAALSIGCLAVLTAAARAGPDQPSARDERPACDQSCEQQHQIEAGRGNPDNPDDRAAAADHADRQDGPKFLYRVPLIVFGGPEGAARERAMRYLASFQAAPQQRMEKAAYLGVSATPAPQALRQQLQLPKGVGLVVDFVSPRSPADEAGLRQYDVLHKLDDQILVNPQQLAVLIRTHKAGDEVRLAVVRDGKTRTLTAKLQEKDVPPLDDLRLGAFNDLRLRGEGELDGVFPNFPKGADNPFGHRPAPSDQDGSDGKGEKTEKNNKGEPRAGGDLLNKGLLQDDIIFRWDDGETSMTITTKDGHPRLLARDRRGKTLFDGPIGTEEQRRAVPKDVAEKLDRIKFFEPPNFGGHDGERDGERADPLRQGQRQPRQDQSGERKEDHSARDDRGDPSPGGHGPAGTN